MTVEYVRLADVCIDAQSGFASGKSDPNGVLQVRMNNVTTDGSWDWSKERRVPTSEKQLAKYAIRGGDVLVNVTNSPNLVGKTACFSGAVEPVVFSNHFVRLRFDGNQAEPQYVRRWLNLLWKRRAFEGLCTQWVNQASVRKEDLLALQVPLPPLPEQRRIAAILDKADADRRKRQQTRDLADQFLRSAFLDLFGDPVTNPKGWPVKKLGEVAEIQGGLQVTSKRSKNPIEVPYLRVANVYRNALDLTEIKTIRVTTAELERVALRPSDVLIVEGHGNRDEVGRSAVWDGSVDPCVHQNHLIRARSTDEILASQYLSFYLNSSGGRRQMFRSGKTTSGLNTISTRNVKETKILLPPIEEQERFVHLRSDVSFVRQRLAEGIAMAETLLGSLTQRAFRGEL